MTKKRLLLGLLAAAAVVAGILAVTAFASTNPPPTYSGGYLPAAYNNTSGAMRLVRPWGINGQSVPNCKPPVQWQLPGVAYDSRLCNIGGSFDASSSEYYTEFAINGPQGSKGDTGATGPQGPIGLTGPKGDTGLTGPQGIPGTAGTNGAPGVSPTVTTVPVGDANCPAGGAAITDANNSTAYVCSGQQGQPGQDGTPFSGTFTSGDYSISVTAGGITLQGPGTDKISLTGSGLTVQSVGNISVKGSSNVGIEAGSNFNLRASNVLGLKGGIVGINEGGACHYAARLGDPVVQDTPSIGLSTIIGGDPTVCIGS